MRNESVLVIGGGTFGTSMASVLAHNFDRIIVDVRSQETYMGLQKGNNERYLPGVKLSKNIVPAMGWAEIKTLASYPIALILVALPSSSIREYLASHKDELSQLLEQGVPLVFLSKGIDPNSLELLDDPINEVFGRFRDNICYLSGPSFAHEIIEEQITLVAVAGHSLLTLEKVESMMRTHYFRVLHTYDIKGVLLCGSLKNVLAIAAGIIEGLGLDHNTRAAMITMGMAEMLKFGVVFNIRRETFYGLAGIGDLILTTSSEMSRNKWFGLEIARGSCASEVLKKRNTVVEGYHTAKAAKLLCDRYRLDCPLFTGIYSVLYEQANPQDVVKNLMVTSRRSDAFFF